MSSLAGSLTGSKYKTNWPLLLLIVLMPLRNIQLDYIPNLGGGLNVVNVLFLLALAHSLANGVKLKIKPTINSFLVFYIITSVIALILGYSFLGGESAGLWKAMKDQLIPILMVFIIQKSAQDDIQWRRILLAALISLPYCARVVWSQYSAVSSWHYSDDLRISGTFKDLGANEMGAYSVSMALICLGLLLNCWKMKKWRIVFSVCFLCAAVCVLYSYSRGGYLAFILGCLVVFAKYSASKKLIFPLVLAGLILSITLPSSVMERFSSIDAGEEERDESAESRFVFWAIALEKFATRPVLGFGYHTVQDKRINPHEMDTHNYYVKVLVERGVVGFLTLLILLKMIWGLTKRNLNRDSNDVFQNGLILGFSGAIAALLLGNMFGDRFSHYPIMTSFWTCVALISIIESRRLMESRVDALAENSKHLAAHNDL